MTYLADKVASGDIVLEILINAKGTAIRYDGHPIDGTHIGAAWLRRPNQFTFTKDTDIATQVSINRERRLAQDYIWESLPEHCWLDSPRVLSAALGKLQQLITARDVGFTIPDTIVTNKWESIDSHFPEGDIISKMFRGTLYRQNKILGAFTKRYSKSDDRPTHTVPFPSILQQYISKKREWRVTIVGEKLFSAAIYTDDQAKDDWRILQETDHVTFKAEVLPKAIQVLCHTYLKHYGLRYGAFDLCEREDGSFVFLELNPAGQYAWLEELLDMPISDAIADELIQLVEHRYSEKT